MAHDNSKGDSTQPRPGLLKDQVQLVKRKDYDYDSYEILAIPDPLSFEKGFFAVIRVCQLLVQKNEGLILVGLAGPSGAGKTAFTEKILTFMPSVAVISMDNYNDASWIIDGNFDAFSKLTGFSSNNRRFSDKRADSSATLANQGTIVQLSEQISILTDRMDDLTSRIEDLDTKLSTTRASPSLQNMAPQTEACNGSAPTSYFISGLENGSLPGCRMPSSSSSSQLVKESPLMDEISNIVRGQRQVMHQLDNLSNLLRVNLVERCYPKNTNKKREQSYLDRIGVSLVLTLAIGGLGIYFLKGSSNQN